MARRIQASYRGVGKPTVPRDPSRPVARKDANWRSTDHEGDTGPVECTYNHDEWCRMTGYNPETGRYDRTPENVPPPNVVQQHNPNGKGRKRAQQSATTGQDGGGSPSGGGEDSTVDYGDIAYDLNDIDRDW